MFSVNCTHALNFQFRNKILKQQQQKHVKILQCHSYVSCLFKKSLERVISFYEPFSLKGPFIN